MPSINLKIAPKGEPPLFLELGQGTFLIGRGEDCEVLIEHTDISRKHALLSVREDGVYVEDLGSSNGTFIDDRLAEKATLFQQGHTMTLGDGAIRIEFADREDDASGVGQFRSRVGGVDLDLTQSNYLFKKEIARGGMGTVLEAEDLNTGRTVAIKKMLAGSAASAEGQFRFQQEARIMGFLEHSNIVPMHELGVNEKGIPYYTMKRVRGLTLQQILSGIKAGDDELISDYPVDRLLRIFQKVCDGIAFAHSKGVVHRDLKPENVLVGQFGEVMMMDWGLAKVLPNSPLKNTVIGRMPDILDVGEEMDISSGEVTKSGRFRTRDGQVLGTPNFMPPEQAEGRLKDVDERSDIFSLGGILYSILTLRPPVTGDTVEEVLERMRSGYIPPPVIYNKVKAARLPGIGRRDKRVVLLRHCPGQQIPEPLSRVAMQAMALDREERYASVRELQLDLEAWQTGHVTRAEEAGFGRQLKLFVARNKSAGITAAVVLMFGLLFLLRSYVAEQKTRAAQMRMQDAAPFLEKGVREKIRAGDYDGALRGLDPLIKILPDEFGFLVLKGNLEQTLGRFGPAAEAYQAARRLGADPARMDRALTICDELESLSDGDGLGPEGITNLIAHVTEEGRFAEAKWLATRYEVEKAVSEDELTHIREHLREKDAPAEALERLHIDRQGRLVLDLKSLPIEDIEWADAAFDVIDLSGTQVADLRPLKGMPLQSVNISRTPVVDLEPLRGTNLVDLRLTSTKVADLTPVAGMPALTNLDFSQTEVTDLTPLEGLKELQILTMKATGATDLGPLASADLSQLNIMKCTGITNIEPLQGMKLDDLFMSETSVTNLQPLADSQLRRVRMSGIPAVDFGVLRGKKLRSGWFNESALSDLSVFNDMAIVELHLAKVPAKDFSILQELPLERLTLSGTSIEDLSPLGTKSALRYLDVSYTRIQRLAPIEAVKVDTLLLHGCNGIQDWTVLRRLGRLKRLSVSDGELDPRIRAGCRSLESVAVLSDRVADAVRDTVWRDTSAQSRFWNEHGKRVKQR